MKKFCYKVYYNEASGKKAAFEFINEKGNPEFFGLFNRKGLLKSIDISDYSRGRMNMKFFYNKQGKLVYVKLFDDVKNFFARGKVEYSPDKNVIFIDFVSKDNSKTLIYQIIRSDGKGNDVEIATYSNHGTLFFNHLYFYNTKGDLIRYEFYKELKFVAGFKFSASAILKLQEPSNPRHLNTFGNRN